MSENTWTPEDQRRIAAMNLALSTTQYDPNSRNLGGLLTAAARIERYLLTGDPSEPAPDGPPTTEQGEDSAPSEGAAPATSGRG